MSKIKVGDKVKIIGYEISGNTYSCPHQKHRMVGSTQIVIDIAYDPQSVVVEVSGISEELNGYSLTFVMSEVELVPNNPQVNVIQPLMEATLHNLYAVLQTAGGSIGCFSPDRLKEMSAYELLDVFSRNGITFKHKVR